MCRARLAPVAPSSARKNDSRFISGGVRSENFECNIRGCALLHCSKFGMKIFMDYKTRFYFCEQCTIKTDIYIQPDLSIYYIKIIRGPALGKLVYRILKIAGAKNYNFELLTLKCFKNTHR